MATQNMFNPSSTHFLRFCLFLSSSLHISFLLVYLSVLCKKIFFTFLSLCFVIHKYFFYVGLSVCSQYLLFLLRLYLCLVLSSSLNISFLFFFFYLSVLNSFCSLSFSIRTYFLSIYESVFAQYSLILLRLCVCIVFFPLHIFCAFISVNLSPLLFFFGFLLSRDD